MNESMTALLGSYHIRIAIKSRVQKQYWQAIRKAHPSKLALATCDSLTETVVNKLLVFRLKVYRPNEKKPREK